VRAAVTDGQLQVHGWYFDLDGGELHGYDPAVGRFVLLADGVGGAKPAA
jgi:carbonic anhydrase